jgi:hypothetical protein
MKNPIAVTIEGRRGSVKGKGKLHAVGVECLQIQIFTQGDCAMALNTERKVLIFEHDYFVRRWYLLLPETSQTHFPSSSQISKDYQ